MKRGILAVLAAAAVMALLAGCGGDDGETASLTKAQFVDQANAICKEVIKEKNDLVNELFEQYQKEGKSLELEPKEAGEVAAEALPPVADLPDKLRELGTPEGDEEQVEAIADSYEQGVSEMEEDPGRIYAANYPFKKGDELAEKYGLNACKL